MKTKDFRDLKLAALSVQHPHLVQKQTKAPVNLQESVDQVETVESEESIAEGIASIIEDAERRLNTQFTAEEIAYSTGFILENIQNVALVEHIQNQVGFELNEEEIAYLFTTVEQLNS